MRFKSTLFVLIAMVFYGCAKLIPGRIGPPADISVEITPQRVALGKKLAEGIMACGSCHTTGSFEGDPRQDMYLAGDVEYSEFEGKIAVPNITPDRETGIGAWTDGELIRAITKGLSRDNRILLPSMPWANFGAALTDEEAQALVAYLRTVPEPIRHEVEATDLTMIASFFISTGMAYNMYAKDPFYTDYEPNLETAEGRGKRLAYLGACVDCHVYAPKFEPQFGSLAGGIIVDVPGIPAIFCSNLSPDIETGIGGFSDEQLYNAIKYGMRLRPLPDTEMVRWPMMARIPNHTSLTDDEISDLTAYLRAQPALRNDVLEMEAKEAAKGQ